MKLTMYLFFTLVAFLISFNISAQETKIKLTINSQTELTATLVDNSSATALIDLLRNGPLTIEMRDYGNMEKVGPIGTTLPRNDQQITTEPGDIILYQGNALVIYYAPNSWNFTRLGKIDNISQDDLKAVLGDGDVTVTLEITDHTTNNEEIDNPENLFQVFPNPAKNYIEVSGPFEKVTLFYNTGKSILTTQERRIQLNNIKPGTYFLKIESKDKKAIVRKFIKQ